MIKIICPNNNIQERMYAVDAIFNTLMGCELSSNDIVFDDLARDYSICLDDRMIILEDHFFNKYPEPLSYLRENNIPRDLSFFHGLGMTIPIIYGEDKFVETKNSILLGLDIFASTFFMLTRWEESMLGREDKGDCDENELFCVKHGLFSRPIIHEYEQLLRNLLPEPYKKPNRVFKTVLTHDVDAINTPSWSQIIKCFLNGKSAYSLTYNRTLSWLDVLYYKLIFPDEYSQTRRYVCLANKYRVSEWFYLKVCIKGERGYTYDYRDRRTKKYIEKLSKVLDSDIELGLHPSQLTFNSIEQWRREVDRFNTLLNHSPSIGRNHHLLFNTESLRNWSTLGEHPSENKVAISNCVFHRHLGFRSGISVPYYVFDVFQRKRLDLKEYPCVIMDTAMIQSDHVHGDDVWEELAGIIDDVKKYNGVLVLTWHVLVREVSLFNEYFHLCEHILKYANEIN